ncbi:hypothetical protein [Cupriavidus sp. UME77]|uniref:hypothetical protein n=1 Tax=Cupriavidus sp. UME77 TaxID=1862321 RepID=UPI001602807C|nr:hypothetical protein [Cupriavidus sp. UME77]
MERVPILRMGRRLRVTIQVEMHDTGEGKVAQIQQGIYLHADAPPPMPRAHAPHSTYRYATSLSSP